MIERACEEDVAFRVLAGQQRPDHATIARFVEHHEAAIAGLFGEVLTLCARSGLAKVGVIAVDGTKLQANASRSENLDYEQLAREILEEAKATDAAEDELYGDARGDELPEEFATAQGRRGWLREAKQRLEAERAAHPQPVPRSRPKRVKEAKRRLEEELWTETRANRAYEAYRARGRMKYGRRFGRPPDPYQPPATPAGRINVTDPDSRVVKGLRGFIQGYNAQAVTNEHQLVVAAEVMTAAPDFGHLEPMLDAAQHELRAAGVTDTPGVLLADAGYWHQQQMERIVDRGMLPELDGLGRCLAPDLIGMGDSAKLADDDPGRYTFACHRDFLDAFLDAVGVRDDVTLVLHDWGSALGFDWARRHPGAVRAIAYMEAIVRPFPGWEHWREKSRGIFQALRSPAGEQMVLDENLFVEKILPMAVLRDLTDEEMAEYRRPFAAPGDDRLPTLVWPRQLPIAGAPADVVEICDDYAEWLAATPGIPKLFFNVEPGAILIGAQREFCRTWPDQTEVTVAGSHFVQEDSGSEIGRVIADWLTRIR